MARRRSRGSSLDSFLRLLDAERAVDTHGRRVVSTTYDSWDAFYAASLKGDAKLFSTETGFVGCSRSKAHEYARQGWLDGARSGNAFTSALVESLSNTVERLDVNYNVEGMQIDVARLLNGEPECWQQFDPVVVEGPSQKFLRIVVNTAVSGGVGADIVMQRGAAVCALIELLEYSGRRCELVAVDTGQNFECETHVFVTIKRFEEPLDMPRVAYALAHPAMQRVHMFGLYETWNVMERAAGYQRPVDIPVDLRGDLYIAKMLYHEPQWESAASATQWVRDTLIEQGVTLTS